MLKFLVVTVGILSSPQGEYKDHHVTQVEVNTLQECKEATNYATFEYKGDIVQKVTRCVIIRGA